MQSINAVEPILPSIIQPSSHPSFTQPSTGPSHPKDSTHRVPAPHKKRSRAVRQLAHLGRPVSYQITAWGVSEGARFLLYGHEDRPSGRAKGGGCWKTGLDLIPEIGVLLASAAAGSASCGVSSTKVEAFLCAAMRLQARTRFVDMPSHIPGYSMHTNS